MATRTSTRKIRRYRATARRSPRSQSRRLELLLTAALAIPGLAISTPAVAQSPAESATLSLGYLDYQDHQKSVDGVKVQSPTLYFKVPVGSRTEIEGGFTYDSVSGASAFNLAPAAPAPPVVTPAPAPAPPPCHLLSIQSVAKASGHHSGSGGSSSGGSSSGGSGSSGSGNSGSSGSSSGGSSSGNPLCVNTPSTGGGSTGTGGGSDDEHEGNDDRYLASARLADRLSSATLGTFDDNRTAGDLKVTHYFDSFSVGVGAGYSTESDYDSASTLVESKIWTPNKNTTFALGVSANFDSVSSSADSTVDETKNTESFFTGVTQVLTPDAIVQSNLMFTTDSGYLSDPYRPDDNRPDSRQAFAWLTRYNQYIEPADAALHLDYRLYGDSWGVLSHTLEAAWYQPVTSWLILRPGLRYYSQSAADFYVYDPVAGDLNSEHFSSDQRLADFGGITVGVKLIADLGQGFSTSVGFDYLTQSSDLALGSSGDQTKRDSLDGEFVFIGLTKKF